MSTRHRKRALVVGALALALSIHGSVVFAQNLEVPQLSVKSRVEQRVGITDFSVDYSSPAVKGRRIWGGLVPYGELWRTGANASTKLTASRDFTFGGKAVPAGTYSLFTIPGEASWTVILNGNTTLNGTTGYDTKEDVARATVRPEPIAARERLTFLFADTKDDGTRLDLEWEKLRISVPIQVDTKAQVRAGIDKSLADAWRPHFTAGRWLLDSGGDLDTALGYLDTSIGIKPTWWNTWVRAQVLAKMGRTSDAVASAEKALGLGKGDNVFDNFFKNDVQKSVDDWKKGKS